MTDKDENSVSVSEALLRTAEEISIVGVHAVIDHWFDQHFHNNAFSAQTELYNIAHAAVQKLHETFSANDVRKVEDVVQAWINEHFDKMQSYIPAHLEQIVLDAKGELVKLCNGISK